MTLGPHVRPAGRRLAGVAPAWGERVSVKAGETLAEIELVRASLDNHEAGPVTWSTSVFLDSGAVGALPPGANVDVTFRPAVGSSGNGAFRFPLVPSKYATGGSAVQVATLPARELVILVSCDVPALLDYAVIAQACPLVWVPPGALLRNAPW